jgi:hypothetical protein
MVGPGRLRYVGEISDTFQFVVVVRKTQIESQPDPSVSRRQTELCRTFRRRFPLNENLNHVSQKKAF